MSPRTRILRRSRAKLALVGLIVTLAVSIAPEVRAQSSSIGIYYDQSGVTCSLQDAAPGFINAYVVVRPGINGVSAAQFAVPNPACFTANWVTDVVVPGTLVLGNSQTGVSVALQTCTAQTTHILTIQYYGMGTTGACCELPVLPDPNVGHLSLIDCFFNEEIPAGIAARVNPDESCGCQGNSPPAAPSSPQPGLGESNVSVFTSLGWQATDIDGNLTGFDVYFGKSPDPPLFESGWFTTTYSPPTPLDNLTTYYWRIVAHDAAGTETSSPEWSFTTRYENLPPSPPRNPIPDNGTVGVSVDLTVEWQGLDIDGDPLVYDVYLGTAEPLPLVSASQVFNSYTAAPPLAFATTYSWYIVARDTLGQETPGPVWTFTTRPENYPPGAPVLQLPPNASTGRAIDTDLRWAASDPDPGDTLTFDVSFGTANPPPLVATDFPSTTYEPGTLAYETTYFWQILVRDPHGATASGPVWRFTTRPENYPPLLPGTPTPPNGSTGRLITQTLAWVCTDPDGDALTFDVYFGTANPPPLVSADVETKSYNPGTLDMETLYRWRVVARDSRGAETTGPLWSFTTKANSGPVITSPNPSNNSTNRSPSSTLSWQASDPEGHAMTFDVYFGTTSPPPLVSSDITEKSYNPGLLNVSTKYYWRVRGRDELGAETLGSIWAFTTRANSAPNLPSNPVPADNSAAPDVSLLSWSASDPDGQPVTSNVYFGTTAPPSLVASGLTEPVYDPGPLAPNQRYYWYVEVTDGERTRPSPTWEFATVAPGDVDMDGAVTLADAECAFSLVFLWPNCGGDLETGIAGGVDCVPLLTPRDVRCIHLRALGATCDLCGVPPATYTPVLTQGITYEQDDTLLVTVNLSGVPALRSFSMYVFGTSGVPLARAARRGRTAGWEAFGSRGAIVAGYTTGTTVAMTTEQFVQLYFHVPFGSFSALIEIMFDDLAGAAPLHITYGGGTIPVLFSAFNARADDDGVMVNWRLSGDETAETYSLWRWEEGNAARTLVAEGRVAGTAGSYRDTSVEPATTYHYEMHVRSSLGNEFQSPVATVTTSHIEFALGQNHPNPFNPQTSIPYTLPGGSKTSHVRLFILDVSGGIVRRLVNESQSGGAHTAIWTGDDDRGVPVSSGIYFYVLDVDGKRLTRKLVLLK